MLINGIQVTGAYGFSYKFNKSVVLLGENGSGKSTFVKIMLYALGAKINSFIDELSRYDYCDYVHMEFTTKVGNKYLVIRKLPAIDQVTLMPYDSNGVLHQEDVRILSLSEYSDFLLEEEGYSKDSITYSGTQTATLTFRFLLRTALVDQTTPHSRVLANISGDRNDFLNSQELLNNAIVEKILNTLNQDLQKFRLEYRQKEKERVEINSKLSFYRDLRDEFDLNSDSNMKKIEKVDLELAKIKKERHDLNDFRYEQLRSLEKANNEGKINIIKQLRNARNRLKQKSLQLDFELSDIKNMLRTFQDELEKVKKQLAAQKVLMNIPVTICPVCFNPIDSIEENGLCPHCHDYRPQEVLDSVAGYKRMIEETIKELHQLIINKEDEAKQVNTDWKNAYEKLTREESAYVKELDNLRRPIENIVVEIQQRLDVLIDRENKLRESRHTLKRINELNAQKDVLAHELEALALDIKDAEKKSADERFVFIKFEETVKDIFNKIYGETHDISVSKENFMPIIDGTNITVSNHSESIKVVSHLAYITSILLLNEQLQNMAINNLGFVIYDSPKDKDLDIDKFERFLEVITQRTEGQVILTGSYKDRLVYEKYFGIDSGCFIDFLTSENKLLKNIERNTN